MVRSGRREDVAAIVRLLADDVLGAQRERVEDPVAPIYLQSFDEITAQQGNEVLVAVQDDEIVGCLQLTIIPTLSRAGMRRAQLEGVRVSGCGLVQLTSDATRADARRFYERLGFAATHVGMKFALSA